MIEAGSWEAIRVQVGVVAREFWKLADEILHSVDGFGFIGNARWRYTFCKWTHRG